MLIFEKSQKGRSAFSQLPPQISCAINIDKNLLRKDEPILPALSELEVVRHYTRLSQQNFSIDTHFYPLGSCTMKYNPRGVQHLAMVEAFKNHHPFTCESQSQGILQCLYELQDYLKEITGMPGVCLSPMAGAQGEFAGCAMIKAYHQDKGQTERIDMIVPDGAHGTNPATAAMCGFKVVQVPTNQDGDIDIEALKSLVGPTTAGIMLTNPSTLGVFERNIIEVAKIIHQAGGLLYYDGANLNAILGKVRPGDMGFDVMHMNMHKTFATPHGGGGPGSGPVAVSARLQPFLPIPIVGMRKVNSQAQYTWLTEKDCPQSIGRLSAFMGNVGILLRAYLYIRLLGAQGLKRVGEFATLNANYLMKKLQGCGYTMAYPQRLATHEFIVTLQDESKKQGVTAMDVAKSLLDRGFYAPTTYFPTLIPECLLIEPTETESKQTLDEFVQAMQAIREDILKAPDKVRNAPSRLPCKRLDEVKAARNLDLVWKT
ncbi:MAG: aminomethyl-transferring glycine dehydrogenase subunit GcvPB [Proteobacteria bacterium]|nr:aminomethyl-transferring glycine dehydrogenase subunit GcvPB [Pseudomonadota bacterium]